MGNGQMDSSLKLYGKAIHPIKGEVMVYENRSEAGKFVMKVNTLTNNRQLNFFQNISKGNNAKLITYYGVQGKSYNWMDENNQMKQVKNFQKKSKKNIHQVLWTGMEKFQAPLYWEFLNWDLESEIKYLNEKQQWMKEEALWQIMGNVYEACEYLQTFNVYPFISERSVQFSPGKEPKLYWCDIEPNNMHRPYNIFIHTGQFRNTIYSPQQLLEMNRKKNLQLDYGKCVVFNLGIILLEAICKINIKCLYNYREKLFSEARKRNLLVPINGKYSKQFQEVLIKSIEYFHEDRYGYKQLKEKLEKHVNKNVTIQNSKIMEISSIETCNQLPLKENMKISAVKQVVVEKSNEVKVKNNTKKNTKKKGKKIGCFNMF